MYNYSYYPINCSFLFNGFCYANELEGGRMNGRIDLIMFYKEGTMDILSLLGDL